jgi:hypothetical protein
MFLFILENLRMSVGLNALDQKLSNWDIGVVIIYFIGVVGASIFVII